MPLANSAACFLAIATAVAFATPAATQATQPATAQPSTDTATPQPELPAPATLPDADAVLTRIAFGSCFNQTGGYNDAQRANDFNPFTAVLDDRPDLFLFIGDNMYADLDRRERPVTIDDIHTAYAELAARPGFAALYAEVPILATWDDHDFGLNDAGVELPFKADSQAALLDFFGDPADSPRRSRDGVYGAWAFGPPGRRTQVILLDTRFFRSPMVVEQIDGRRHYVPNDDPAATVLGDEQWRWLEAKLREPADLRLIASSIQVVAGEHRFEKWANFPLQRQRLFDLITETQANGVVFLTGDRHHWELSADRVDASYPLFDLTSSGLNQGSPSVNREPNRHRIGSDFAYRHPNFGTVEIDWGTSPPIVTLSILSTRDGSTMLAYPLLLDTLQPPATPTPTETPAE
ncbi:MAG: alkaline phosphatase D family protein [Planctomycetota bacterium]